MSTAHQHATTPSQEVPGKASPIGGSMTYFIFAIANDRAQVVKTMRALAGIGIASDHVSVLAADHHASGDLAAEIHAKAAHGAFSAGNIGGGLGWLAGLGTLAIPGIGLFVAAGPILGFLTGIAVGRSLGSLSGAMIEEMGIPDSSVPQYDAALKEGKIILSARCEDAALRERIIEVMQQAGLDAVGSTPETVPPIAD